MREIYQRKYDQLYWLWDTVNFTLKDTTVEGELRQLHTELAVIEGKKQVVVELAKEFNMKLIDPTTKKPV